MVGAKWVFLRKADGGFENLPSELYRTLISEKGSAVFPEFGGRTLEIALVHLELDLEMPVRVRAVEFRRCKLTKKGSLDQRFQERRKKLTSELASIRPHRMPAGSNVVDAARRFKERRFVNEFAWTPTISMVQELARRIEEKSEGSLKAKEVLHMILRLTATA